LKFRNKHIVIIVAVFLLLIPIFFGIYIDFLIVRELSLDVVLILVIGFVILLGIGKLTEKYLYNERSKEIMKQHDVVKALMDGNNKLVLIIIFPLTMIMEELIFRYYLIGILLNELNVELILTFVISSVIFSLYHIHIWFRFTDRNILISYLITSFLLGIYNGFILLNLGIFACIIVHGVLVFIIYYNLYKKLSK
jgi:membrane protease YdiL (CAAX protease family)